MFPIEELVKLVKKSLTKAIEINSVTQTPPKGYLSDLFSKAGVSRERLDIITNVVDIDA